jgi:hypothetical protein
MQFTPQQLAGGPRYASKVKIGNWSEERSRVEVRARRRLSRCVVLPSRRQRGDPTSCVASPSLHAACRVTRVARVAQMELKDFELRKARGELVTTHKAEQRRIAMQKV